MIKTLRKRFIRIAMLAVTAVLLALCLIVNAANYISVDNSLTNMLQIISNNRGMVPQSPPGGFDKPGTRPEGGFTPETPFSTRYFVLWYDADGTLLRSDLGKIAAVTEADTAEYLQAAAKHGAGYCWVNGYRCFVSQSEDGGFMAIFLDAHRDLQTVKTTAWLSLAAMLFCVACVYLGVTLLSRRAIDPVVRSAEQQKQFITDASHELKTPITVIATSLKVLEMDVGPQKWIDKARAQTEKLKALVNSLVTLSRMDEEQSPLHMEPFPVSDAVAETAESFREVAEGGGHALALSVTPGLTYTGDEYAVRQLVSILLDNAVKYAAPSAPIELTLEKARRGVALRVSNRWENVGSIDTGKLFDRFYRADPARTAGGFGIGLSIARSIAEGHRGAISARTEGDTITFTALLK